MKFIKLAIIIVLSLGRSLWGYIAFFCGTFKMVFFFIILGIAISCACGYAGLYLINILESL